MSFLKRIL